MYNTCMKFVSDSAERTYDFGVEFAAGLTGGEVISVKGELGAGKTVFAKGLAHGMGIKETVVSPTFTVMNDYKGDKLFLYHYDAYRLSGFDEAEECGLTEYLQNKDGVCLIEWAENLGKEIERYITDVIEIVIKDGKREIYYDKQTKG